MQTDIFSFSQKSCKKIRRGGAKEYGACCDFVITAALLAEIVCGIFFTNQFGAAMSNMLYWVGDNFGWWINLLTVFCVIVGIVIVIFRWGDVKIGGKDAKPGPFAAASAAV